MLSTRQYGGEPGRRSETSTGASSDILTPSSVADDSVAESNATETAATPWSRFSPERIPDLLMQALDRNFWLDFQRPFRTEALSEILDREFSRYDRLTGIGTWIGDLKGMLRSVMERESDVDDEDALLPRAHSR